MFPTMSQFFVTPSSVLSTNPSIELFLKDCDTGSSIELILADSDADPSVESAVFVDLVFLPHLKLVHFVGQLE